MKLSRFYLIALFLLMSISPILYAGCSYKNEENNKSIQQDVTLDKEYKNRHKDYTIKYPSDWEYVEDTNETIQSFDKVHFSPAGYEGNELFPYLLTIDVSSFSLDQNMEIARLTSDILDEKSEIYGDKWHAKKLYLKNKKTGEKAYEYIFEYIGGASIVLYLRSDDPNYKAVLDAMWNTLNIRH